MLEYIDWINIEGGGDLKKFEQTEKYDTEDTVTELDIAAWLAPHSVRSLARYVRVHCPAWNDTSLIVLLSVGTTSRELCVGLGATWRRKNGQAIERVWQ